MNFTQQMLVAAVEQFYIHQDTASLRVVDESFTRVADECTNVDEATHLQRMVNKFKGTLQL